MRVQECERRRTKNRRWSLVVGRWSLGRSQAILLLDGSEQVEGLRTGQKLEPQSTLRNAAKSAKKISEQPGGSGLSRQSLIWPGVVGDALGIRIAS